MKKTRRSYNSTLRAVSKKTTVRNQVWKERCLWRISYLVARYGFLICEYCGKAGSLERGSFLEMWGHHIDSDRDNTDLSNCYICHNTCHSEITDNNIIVSQEDFQGKDA